MPGLKAKMTVETHIPVPPVFTCQRERKRPSYVRARSMSSQSDLFGGRFGLVHLNHNRGSQGIREISDYVGDVCLVQLPFHTDNSTSFIFNVPNLFYSSVIWTPSLKPSMTSSVPVARR